MEKDFQISETSKKQDKKYFKSFILIMICSGLGGGIVGASMTGVFDYASKNDVYRMLGDMQLSMAPVFCGITFALLVVYLLVLSAIYGRTKKDMHQIDVEDDISYKKLEGKISSGLIVSNIGYLLGFMTFGIGSYCLPKNSENGNMVVILFMVNCLSLFGLVIGMMFFQNRFINLYKELSPEKQVSTYDMKFQKKWLENCDEAERMMIYQASYQVYRIMNKVYTGAAVILGIIGMGFEVGIFPFIIVMVLWLTSQIIYFVASTRQTSSTITFTQL